MPLQEPRHQITLLCFLATFTAYVERVGFSIAYTAMAKRASVSEAIKGTVLSSFYWGYGLSQVNTLGSILRNCNRGREDGRFFQCMPTIGCLLEQVPGGYMAQRYGGHITLIVSFTVWSIASLLTPKSAVNSRAITVARILVGVAQGFIIPSIHTVLSQVRLLGTLSLEGVDQLLFTF